MPDERGDEKTEAEDLPETPLHAYKEEDRLDEIEGDPEKLDSDDPKDLRQKEIADDSN
jgi:hypothetical protein